MKTALFLMLVACSKSEEPNAKPKADPWGAAPTTASDPWAASDATPAPTAKPAASTLAGSYQCQQMRYKVMPNGMNQSTYVPSALGVFEVDGDGTYRSESYADKGTGRARIDGTTVTFEEGPYPNAVGVAETISSGFLIRFSENLHDAPAPNLRFNDHLCYRKK